MASLNWVYSEMKININQKISAFSSHLTKGFILLYILENLLKTEFASAEKLACSPNRVFSSI